MENDFNIRTLYFSIVEEFKNKNYEKVIELINKYTDIDKIGIDTYLMYIYGRSLYKLKLYNESTKVFEILCNLNNTGVNRFLYALSCYSTRDHEKAKLLFRENILDKLPQLDNYYFLGKIELMFGNYQEAKRLFTFVTKYSNNKYFVNLSERFIKNINKHLTNGNFIQMYYSVFTEKRNEISPKYIIYLESDVDYINCYNPDNLKNLSRPYLIYKVDGDKVLAYPLTTSTEHGYKLDNTIYMNLKNISCTKCELVEFNKNDIGTVLEKINDYDYNVILENIEARTVSLTKKKIKI